MIQLYMITLKKNIFHAEEIVKQHYNLGIKIISYFDEIYPESFRKTLNEQGTKRKPPIILFCKGNISLLGTPCITMIGSRSCTAHAFRTGEKLAENFAKKGFTIVSGLAAGCDTSAHIGALKSYGKTIAILAHGLDRVYPAKNRNLLEEILKNDGLLISEYPIGQKPSPYKFVERDRLQASLSIATIVIQSGIHGGSMHAANAAYNSHKLLFAVKYDDEETLHHENTSGNIELIKKGASPISINDNFDNIVYKIYNNIN